MFWENYVDLCSRKGLSPNAVAAELGKSSGSVTAWKNGTVPRETTLKKIADYFDVSVDFLIGREKEKSPAQTSEGQVSKDASLIKWFRSLPPEKQRAILIAQDGPIDAAD